MEKKKNAEADKQSKLLVFLEKDPARRVSSPASPLPAAEGRRWAQARPRWDPSFWPHRCLRLFRLYESSPYKGPSKA